MNNRAIFIDPSSRDFLQDKLFDGADTRLNRDGTLVPFVKLREDLAAKGIVVHTADKLRDGSERRKLNDYWSLGLIDGYQEFVEDSSVSLRGFILMEPPLVQPHLYADLPKLTTFFDQVFLHNTIGDGYDLTGVNRERLKRFDWPQPYSDILPEYWNRENRLNKLVVIAGSHKPRRGFPELYSKRIEAVAALGPIGGIDLYGRGWNQWWGRDARWLPYWQHQRPIMKNYYGSCTSKWEILSQYRFSLCFENMQMSGYVTEKIFDCFLSGTVPIYLGAPNISDYISEKSFVDMRDFSSFEEMYEAVSSMNMEEWSSMREQGRRFMKGKGGLRHAESLKRIISA